MINNNIVTDLNGNKIADVLTFIQGLDQTKIISRLYDGSVQIQTVGTPISYADVEIFVYSDTMDDVNTAEVQANLLRISYKDIIYSGYIESPVDWEPIIKGNSYRGKIKFLIAG